MRKTTLAELWTEHYSKTFELCDEEFIKNQRLMYYAGAAAALAVITTELENSETFCSPGILAALTTLSEQLEHGGLAGAGQANV